MIEFILAFFLSLMSGHHPTTTVDNHGATVITMDDGDGETGHTPPPPPPPPVPTP